MATTAHTQAWHTATKLQLPFGPGTFLFNREIGRRERLARLDAEIAKLTPANIAALETATAMLLDCGYPVPA